MVELCYKLKKIIAISDTHGRHRDLIIPKTDFLIHCGDACTDGDEAKLEDFFQWFSVQQAQYKIFVAGNHDLIFDLEPELAKAFIQSNVIFLEDEQIIIEGISFYSVSARPWLHSYPPIKERVDFLLTHAPAFSILDLGLGCKIMLRFIVEQNPSYHLFGHIHQTANLKFTKGNTQFINVAIINI